MDHEGPTAIRYPRGTGVGANVSNNPRKIPLGKGEIVHEGDDAIIITLGSRVYPAVEAAMELEKEGLNVAVFNTRFVKPLPKAQILELAAKYDNILLVEENALAGGFGSAVLEMLNEEDALTNQKIKRLGLPDEFIEHGTQKELRHLVGIDMAGIKKAAKALCNK